MSQFKSTKDRFVHHLVFAIVVLSFVVISFITGQEKERIGLYLLGVILFPLSIFRISEAIRNSISHFRMIFINGNKLAFDNYLDFVEIFYHSLLIVAIIIQFKLADLFLKRNTAIGLAVIFIFNLILAIFLKLYKSK